MTMNLAVLGSPIEHSLSPVIHGSAYAKLGVDATYTKFDVTEGSLAEFLKSHANGDWRGFSLTMPLKEAVIPFLSSFDRNVEISGSCNTIVWEKEQWTGYNTDVTGFEYLLKDVEQSSIAILGAGGTARSALLATRRFGAPITVYRRSPKRDAQLLRILPRVEIRDWSEVKGAFSKSLVINASPITAAVDYMPIAKEVDLVIDSIYAPWPPPLCQLQLVGRYLSGKKLLVAQGVEQIRIFSGAEFDRDDMYSHLLSELYPH